MKSMRASHLVLFATSFAVVTACGRGSAQSQEENGTEPIPVRAAPVVEETIARRIVSTGTVAPKDEIALSFKMGGIVEDVAVDAGEAVAAGQTLATLDLREIEAALSKARAGAEKAERDLERAERLYADSVMALAQFQDAQTAAEVARADIETAEFDRRYAVIVAPAAGTILSRSVETGELASAGTTVLTLGSRARGTVVRVGLADRDLVRVQPGDGAVVRFEAFPDRAFSGTVTEIAAAAEPGTGTYRVEITMRDADALLAGMVGEVEIRTGRGVPGAVVPIEAVLEADGTEATVFALSPDGTHAERRRVTVLSIEGDRVAIGSGLEGVESVLTDGAAWLDDGAIVRVER